jgi:hypothetical protein
MGEGGHGQWVKIVCLFLSCLSCLLRGTHTPSFAHSAPMRADDFLSYEEGYKIGGPPGGPGERFGISLLSFRLSLATYPVGMEAVKRSVIRGG